MSVMMASTCLPSVKARYSAAVRAKRGVSRRWVLESDARLRNSAVRAKAPDSSSVRRKNSALSYGRPMPANTITNSSASALLSLALMAMLTAMRSCGRPPPEKSGSFCPRTSEFMRSMVVMPVSMKSRGVSRSTGFIGSPSIGRLLTAATGGPPSITCPTPLKMRPRMPGPTSNCRG